METSINLVQPKIDENAWVIQIKEGLEALQQQEDEEEFCASVFNVAKELLAVKPEAYIPQSVSIGPYHHWRPELYEMERYKLVAVHRFEKRINKRGKFQSVVVQEFKKHDLQIRSCYHKFIDYEEETLAWFMALDAVFLLECLQFYVRHANKTSDADFKQLGRVLHLSGTSAAHNSIVRDLMMLENQLPLFLLQKLLELQTGSKIMAEERLSSLLTLVCQELSPFTFNFPDNSNFHINERGHVLEVLYYAIVPIVSSNEIPNPTSEEESESPDTVDISTVRQAFSALLWKALSSLNVRPLRLFTELRQRSLNLKPFTVLVKKDTIKSEKKRSEEEGEGKGEESFVKIIPPTRDELAIPSVADLHSAGIKFIPTDGDLSTIHFEKNTATLYLPKVKVDINTEVILRNLVAFEASAAPGALVFTRYTDFMNGIIDSKEDVRLLREKGIISSHLKRDKEIARLWNSMGRCVNLTKVEFLDRVIEDVNTYYNRKWKVVVVKFVKKHIFGSWKFLTLVAAAILLALSCLQAFCSVYECKNWFNQSNLYED
jgi:hypothetical protein